MKVNACAKINLFLDITGIRQDGYHTLEMIMQSVSLCDEVRVSLSDNGITVYTEGIEQEKNIAYRAAKAFFEKTGIQGGLEVHIEKKIPMQAGLGGGSADAAAVLLCANELFGNPLSEEELLLLGNTVGADVPFALKGGTALAKGTGDELADIENRLACAYVIVKPEGGVNTKEAFSLFDRTKKQGGGDLSACVASLEHADINAFAKNAYNALEPAAKLLCPEINGALTGLLADPDVKCAFMTGSGSACVGICEDEAAAYRVKSRLEEKNLQVFIAKNTDKGILPAI